MARMNGESDGRFETRVSEVKPAVRGGAPLTVGQVSDLVKTVLANHIPAKVRVVGEVSNFSARTHWFFSLKDDQATLGCVCFASAARAVSFPVTDGLQVVATGRIDYYEAQGRLQFYVNKIELVGQGELELRFRALCEDLRRLGYFDHEKKKPLPLLPRRVAVVTSRNAAALQDVINTSGQRWPGCRLMLIDVRVQGQDAASEIAQAIDALSQHAQRLGIDAIILTRGGGSIEDLWAFNERVVAQAVYACRLPIVAAIGHETDTTIAELVADVRCATPTQAAMTLIPDRAALSHQVDQYSKRLTLLLRRVFEHSCHRLDAIERHPVFRRPLSMLELAQQRLDALRDRLVASLPRRLETQRNRLEALARQLESIGPRNVLQRGYSYTVGPDGRVLRSPTEVNVGDQITTMLAEGRVESRVGMKPSAALKPKRPRRSRSKRREADEPGLFEDS